ncbi:hypothetical protein [Nocardia tengchongensis]|uniref:hypothetical protein n=1 Tax=Nocardia tengchongensis TaxID=2055889 RepID=UPI00369A35A1
MTHYVKRQEQDKTVGTGYESECRTWVLNSHDRLKPAREALEKARAAFEAANPTAFRTGSGTNAGYSVLLIERGLHDGYGDIYRNTRFWIGDRPD